MAEQVRIIQWNCRSFAKKRAALQFAMTDLSPKIDVIALQETESAVKITGYTSFNELPTSNKSNVRTAIAVHRNIAAMQIDLEIENLHYTFVQLKPVNKQI